MKSPFLHFIMYLLFSVPLTTGLMLSFGMLNLGDELQPVLAVFLILSGVIVGVLLPSWREHPEHKT